MIDADKAKQICHDVLRGVKPKDSRMPYNAEAKAYHKQVKQNMKSIPQGATVDVPHEWPSISHEAIEASKARIAANAAKEQ